MPLEQSNTINELNATYPLGDDPSSQGDDHIRLIKKSVKGTFPNIIGVVTANTGQLNMLANTQADVATLKTTKAEKNLKINAGAGLTGGGELSINPTLAVGQGDGIIIDSNNVNVDSTVVRNNDNKNYSTSGIITTDSGSFIVRAANSNAHLWYRESSNNASRVVAYYNRETHDYRVTLYQLANPNLGASNLILSGSSLTSTVPFTGNGSGLTNIPATSLTGIIDDARLPATVVRGSRNVNAGNGLIGGGALSGNPTLSVGKGDGITVNATNVAVDATVVRTSRTITAGAGLTGGGALSGNISLAVGAGSGITVGATTVGVDSTVVRTDDNKNYSTTGSITSDSGSLTVRSSNMNSHLWYRESSNNASRVVAYYNRAAHAYSVQLYQEANPALGESSLTLSSNSFTSTVPFTGSGAGLTDVPATSLTGTINDARIPSSVARTSVNIVAGNGLSGGGTISASRTLTLGTPTAISDTTTNAVTSTSHTHALDNASIFRITSSALTGSVGTYAFLGILSGSWIDPGALVAGSNLYYSAGSGRGGAPGVAIIKPAGTWKCMGRCNTFDGTRYNSESPYQTDGSLATLFLRVS